jgi:uncharacterized protein YjbI with pentapeptide repeats
MKVRIPDSVRKDVQMRIKNRIDISDLIANYSIKGEDLTGAIIKKLDRNNEDISNLNLTNAIVGIEDGETHLSRAVARNCNFKGTKFLGKVIAKKTDFTGTTFVAAYLPLFDYRFATMHKCTFCDAVFTIGTNYSYGSKFDSQFFKDLGQMWNLQITILPDKTDEEI